MNPSRAEIRELGEDDVLVFRDLRARALADHPGWFGESHEAFVNRPIEDVARAMTSDQRFTLGAFDQGILVGMARCSRGVGVKDAHKAMVTSVYVDPAARGKGVGKSLMNSLFEAVRRWPDVEELRLTVVVGNIGARQLYRSLGFEVWGTEPRAMKIGDKYVGEEHMFLLLDDRAG